MNWLLVASPALSFSTSPPPCQNPSSFDPLTFSPYSDQFPVFVELVPFARKALPPSRFAPPPFNLWLASQAHLDITSSGKLP